MTKSDNPLPGWAVILGASSGFGGATAVQLARSGADILGVHLDRRASMPKIEQLIQEIRGTGREAVFHNVNAIDHDKRKTVIDDLASHVKRTGKKVRVLMHSLAFGTLRPYVGAEVVSPQQMTMTLEVMAHSLVWWTQDLVNRDLMMSPGGRVYAMTSAGGTRVIQTYGPVSAAKAALESHIRQLAFELAPKGITANAIRAGVTDTPALRKIPGNDRLLQHARELNPHGRLTEPNDVASAIADLSRPGTHWITGNTLGIDGGEDIVS